MDRYLELKRVFQEHRNHDIALKMSAYMQHLFKFYGLPAPIRKSLYKKFLKNEKQRKIIDWDTLDTSYKDEYREFQYFVIDYLDVMKGFLSYDDMSYIKKYIKSKQWWDTIDGFAKIVGFVALTDHNMDELLLSWSKDKDIWVRRIAIEHQLCRKQKTKADLLEQILVNNLDSSEFFINKAVGWALRDYSKTDPEWVRNFVSIHSTKLNKLTIKEASKYL